MIRQDMAGGFYFDCINDNTLGDQQCNGIYKQI